MNTKKNSNDYKGQLDEKGVIAFVPEGDSMWPTIKNGKSSVIIEKKKERLSVYDVALYNRNGANVLHRVIEVNDNGYIMCGDSLKTKEQVDESEVFGVMIGYYRGKKYVDVNDERYLKKITKLFKKDKIRILKASIYFFIKRVKNKIKRIFNKK